MTLFLKRRPATLLNSSAVAEGAWVDVANLERPFAVAFDGFAAGDVAQLIATNRTADPALAAPASGDGQILLRDNITAKLMFEISGAMLKVRARKSAAGGAPAVTTGELFGLDRHVFS